MAQLVKHPALGVSSGLRVVRLSPASALGMGLAFKSFSLSLSAAPLPKDTSTHSLKKNKK